MQHAYLVLAHDQPDQLRRMIERLNADWARFYVHIDKKANLAAFKFGAKEQRNNVVFLDERISVNWMGFSIVDATLRLLRRASLDGFGYCTLLSGTDYPIKSNGYLHHFFENADKEYIAFWRLYDRPTWLPKVHYFYFIDNIPIRAYSLNSDESFWRRFFWGRFFKYQKHMPKRQLPGNVVPYGGPDWWTLSFDCVAWILRYVDTNPKFVRFYRRTASPGEMFFQTLILNSPWRSRVNAFGEYELWRSNRSGASTDCDMLPDELFNLRYADWSGEKSGERACPAVLDERDWLTLKSSSALFARKFDTDTSRGLMEQIDAKLLDDIHANCTRG